MKVTTSKFFKPQNIRPNVFYFRHSYSVKEDNHQLLSLGHHKKGCRAVRFSPAGESLFSVSKDKSLQMVDLDQGTVKHCIKQAHP